MKEFTFGNVLWVAICSMIVGALLVTALGHTLETKGNFSKWSVPTYCKNPEGWNYEAFYQFRTNLDTGEVEARFAN